MTLKRAFGAGLAVVALGCGASSAPPKGKFEGPEHDATVQKAFLQGARTSEESFAGARKLYPKVLIDEAWVTYIEHGTTCIDVIARTPVEIDRPLAEWDTTLNGLRVYFEPEKVTVRDVSGPADAPKEELLRDDVSVTVADVQGLPAASAQVLRVVERRAQVCGKGEEKREPMITLELELNDNNGDRWHEAFGWEFQRRGE